MLYMHFDDGRMRAALAGRFLDSRVALLAKLVEDAPVFTGVVNAPMSHGYHNAKVQDGTEHQHERDGKVEAGPAETGGFTVTLRLPFEQYSETRK